MLKGRLDGLRKAKNTTIFRREREEIKVSSPNLGKLRTKSPSHLDVLTLSQQCGSCHGDLQEQIRDLNSQVRQHYNRKIRPFSLLMFLG